MKRSAALTALSREHHSALVLALRIARAEEPSMIDAILQSIPHIFQHQLEPHFLTEERELLPRLEAGGESELVRRTSEEHRRLRLLAARLVAGDASPLKEFGSLLADHVRFEERELFRVAEAVLAKDDPGAASMRGPQSQ